MSDPPKKPGSLRDRIAAFEKQGASTPSPAPPAPRPKPAGVSWKPRPRSPPSSPPPADNAHGSDKPGAMSAADAKASIGQGVSLKERMAALQGLSAFGGGPSPPPKPATEKPKWKPPPVVATPPAEEIHEGEKPKPVAATPEEHAETEEHPKVTVEVHDDAEAGDDQTQPDPEEEERKRRAAIAARMARLGGARVGMAPPVFGRKPDVKKPQADEPPSVDVDREKHSEVSSASEQSPGSTTVLSPPATSLSASSEHPDAATTDYLNAKESVLHSPDAEPATAVRSPSMPVPLGPRRAAPPRKRPAKSPSPAPATILGEGVVNQSPSPVPGIPALESTSASEPHGDREPEIRQSQIQALMDDLRLPDTDHAREAKEVLSGNDTTIAEAAYEAHKSEMPQQLEQTAGSDSTALTVELEDSTHHSSPGDIKVTTDAEEQRDTREDDDPPISEQKAADLEEEEEREEEEEEEEEIARRKRIAERLAKMGGVNPLSGPPPVPTSPPASSPVVERRQSLRKDSGDDFGAHKSPEVSAVSEVRRSSIDSIGAGRLSGTVGIDEIPSSPATSPASPKSDVLARKGSVGSVHSNADTETAAPRMSQDDLRPIRGYAPVLHEEPEFATESVERSVTEQEGGEEVEPHVEHDAPDEMPRVDETYRQPVNERVHEDEGEQSGGDEHAESDLQSEKGEVFVHEGNDEGAEQAAFASAARSSSTLTEAAPAELSGSDQRSQQPLISPPIRAPSKRQSVPPPPRAPPPVPEHPSGEEEFEASYESIPSPSPPVRRSTRPPVPPTEDAVVDLTLHQPYSSRPVTYLEVQDDGQPASPSEYGDDEAVDVGEQEYADYDPDYIEADDDSLQPVMNTHMEGSEISESEEVPPPPPPRRTSVRIPTVSVEHNVDYVEEHPHTSPPISPPPPPERRQMRISTLHAGSLPPVDIAPIDTLVEPKLSPGSGHSAPEQEVLDDSDVDPIDPAFYSPQRSISAMPESPPTTNSEPTEPAPVPDSTSSDQAEVDLGEDSEQVRRRTIAERMAKLGGIRFGAPPPPPARRPPPPTAAENDDVEEEPSDTANSQAREETTARQESEAEEAPEEDEFARKQRIAARIAGMGGMRFGMLPGTAQQRQSAQTLARQGEVAEPDTGRALPPQRSALPVPSSPVYVPDNDLPIEHAEEAEADIVTDEVQDVPPPPVPSRQGRRGTAAETRRPSVPQVVRPPVPQVPISPVSSRSDRAPPVTEPAAGTAFTYPPPPIAPVRPPVLSHDTQGDYVIVDEEETVEEPPPPPPRTVSLKKAHPPPRALPPPPIHAPDPQLEPPSIPNVDFGGGTDLSLSGQWSEDSTNYPPALLAKSGASGSSAQPDRAKTSRAEVNMSPDELVSQWGRVGVQIHEIASVLFEKSKKSLVGDGSYLGFVNAALGQVPNAMQPEPPFESFGYLIYAQNGSAVQRRISDVMPGDVVVLQDAKFKGHKGLQIYHQHVGAEEPVYAIVGDYEAKKSKVKVFQANQHVGQQTVESTSYRLEDLKSGAVKIFRVLEA